MDPELRKQLADESTIDPSELDVAAVAQAELFFQWSERAIAAKDKVERLEASLETLEAKLQMRCRRDPKSFKLENPTEAGVKAAVRISSKYQAKLVAYHDAKMEAALLTSAAACFEQKKRMIEVLTTLHGQQYFAGPSVPHNLVAAWKDHQQRREEALLGRQKAGSRKPGEKRKGG